MAGKVASHAADAVEGHGHFSLFVAAKNGRCLRWQARFCVSQEVDVYWEVWIFLICIWAQACGS